jgi:cyclohexanone monooxygenase
MLQRSPTYMISLPGQDPLARLLKHRLPPMWAYRAVRMKNILIGMLLFKFARRWPERAKARLLGLARRQLGPQADMARDFTPRYNPWDQRICALPDGDLFDAVRAGRASLVTDTIQRFTPAGIRLASGRELAADIVVTATGLELNTLGDMALSVDGQPLQAAATMAYKGMMFSGVPNLVQTFGYTNASWTLKADLTADYTCRLMRHMQRHGLAAATPRRDPAVGEVPFLDFSSGYVQRALPMLPRQGDRKPWRLYQNYLLDWLTLRLGRIDDGHLHFTPTPPTR